MTSATKNQKAQIHILKNQFKLDDDTYRDLMFEHFKVFSSIDLTEDEAEKFIHILQMKYSISYKQGFKKAFELLTEVELSPSSKVKQFKTLVHLTEKRQATNFEIEMFKKLDVEVQTNYINDLISKL